MDSMYSKYRHMPDFRVISHLPSSTLTREEALLSLVVVLGSSISLVGLIFAFITYSLFSDLKNMSGTMLMNLLASLFMSQLMYVIGVGGTENSSLCLSLAFALQLFHLAEFCWLLALAHNMHHTFRNNLSTVHTLPTTAVGPQFIRYSLFGWGMPIIIVLCAYLVRTNPQDSNAVNITINFRNDHLNCWFLDNATYICSYVLPVIIILTSVAHQMYKTRTIIKYSVALQSDTKIREKISKNRFLEYHLYLKIIIILFSTFLLGVIARVTHSNVVWIGFNIEHSVQGLIVAIIVACNCQTLKIYAKSLKKRRPGTEHLIREYQNGTSRSSSLESLLLQPELTSV